MMVFLAVHKDKGNGQPVVVLVKDHLLLKVGQYKLDAFFYLSGQRSPSYGQRPSYLDRWSIQFRCGHCRFFYLAGLWNKGNGQLVVVKDHATQMTRTNIKVSISNLLKKVYDNGIWFTWQVIRTKGMAIQLWWKTILSGQFVNTS